MVNIVILLAAIGDVWQAGGTHGMVTSDPGLPKYIQISCWCLLTNIGTQIQSNVVFLEITPSCKKYTK